MLDVEVVSHKELCWRGNATYVTIPALGGSLGIMKDHTPFLSLLEEGKVSVTDEHGEEHHFQISGDAFATLTANQVIVVADIVEHNEKV